MLASIKPLGDPSGASNLGQAAPGFPETAAKNVSALGQSDGEPPETLLAATPPLFRHPGNAAGVIRDRKG